MNAGRELDALIAERVMGFACDDSNGKGLCYICQPENYSTDIADAWEVVEKMRDLNWSCDLRMGLLDTRAWFWRNNTETSTVDEFVSQDRSAPAAICLAALKATDPSPASKASQ